MYFLGLSRCLATGDYIKMVTPKQAYRATISLAYRRRLSEDIPKLEATIRDYLNSLETNQTKIAGYRVIRDNGNLILEETEPVDLDQLRFKFMEVKANGD